jgi:hypothetical protein
VDAERTSTDGASIDDPAVADAANRAAEAKSRRAARKAARAAQPPPERDPVYDALSLADLRDARTALSAEETKVSYWRRIIQARLDLVRSDVTDHSPVADLTRVLTEGRSSVRRLAHIDTQSVDGVPPLPDLAEVWGRVVDPADEVGRLRLLTDLSEAETELSQFRRELHRRIDLMTAELIARYREQPLLALQILPDDPLRRHASP